jgi:hypothetical protein
MAVVYGHGSSHVGPGSPCYGCNPARRLLPGQRAQLFEDPLPGVYRTGRIARLDDKLLISRWNSGIRTLRKLGSLSQVNYSLSATADGHAEPRLCRPPNGESSTGTACSPLLSGLDLRSVLCPSRTRPHRVCRPRPLPGDRRLQGDRVRNEARPRRAAQDHGTRSGTPDRRSASNRTLAVGGAAQQICWLH